MLKVDNRTRTIASERAALNTEKSSLQKRLGKLKGEARRPLKEALVVIEEKLSVLARMNSLTARGRQIDAAYEQHRRQVAEEEAGRRELFALIGQVLPNRESKAA
jgi:hypothetical protein